MTDFGMNNQTNKKLAIAIPTYNRGEILYENLTSILPEIVENNIAVYVSDNGTDENTAVLMNKLKEQYGGIYYEKDTNNPGYENNIIKTLLLPSEEYVWLLGDGMMIQAGSIKMILNILNQNDFEFLGLNTTNKRVAIEATIYDDPGKLLLDINWHLTLLGATVYSKQVIPLINQLDKVQFKNFIQNALIFHGMLLPAARFYWTNIPALTGNNRKQSYWSNKVFDTFMVDLSNTIEHLPDSYKPIDKMVYSAHAKHSKLFSLYNLLSYRKNEILTTTSFKKYKPYIQLTTDTPLIIWKTVSSLPLFIVNPIILIANLIKKIR